MDDAQRSEIGRRVKRRLKVLAAVVGILVLALAAVYFATPQWLLGAYENWQARSAGLQKNSVLAGDTRWVYYEGGKGPTLVLLHGYMADKSVWLPLAKYLAPNFRVVIPDLPGWGESGRNPQGDYGYGAQVQRLHRFVDTLQLGAVAIAGHSMGGAIAGDYAATYPGDVAALVLVDSAGVPFKENAFARALKAGRNPFDIGDRAGFERLIVTTFAKPPWLPPRIEDVFVARAVRDRAFADDVMRRITAPGQNDILVGALPTVTAPTLTIWCREDRVIDVSAMDAIRNGLKRAPQIGVAELNGCGHMSIMERPREVADAITHFVLMP